MGGSLGLFAVLLSSLLILPALGSKKVYIVYLGAHSHGKVATFEDFQGATSSHRQFLESFVDDKKKAREAMVYSYTKHINAFAAYLEEEEAAKISNHPAVISVFPNGLKQLHTTRTWGLLGLEGNSGQVSPASLWKKASYGKDVIIAHLDTGVWPESASFSDDGMGPIPSRWRGSCQKSKKSGVFCNRKLIGAKYFDKGYKSMEHLPSNASLGTARDTEGHGTHTLSTAGGRFVVGASLFGYANGTAKGGSPEARVATYKVCWEEGCSDADILAGFDEAIHDGVDVLSVSLGGHAQDFASDSIALGAFHAAVNGISVACSAGNEGPYDGSVANTAPWVTTVAASTVDRGFFSTLTLSNNKTFVGYSMAYKGMPANKSYPLINSFAAKAANASNHEGRLCYIGSLDPKKVKGKIVVCLRGEIDRLYKSEAVLKAGGVGVVIINNNLEMVADPHRIPATLISYKDGSLLQSYLNSTKSLRGSISAGRTAVGVKPAPKIADFSSRGPSLMAAQVLKPDVAAPGVKILASFTEAVPIFNSIYDKRKWPFTLMSGTSMSCPHVAGVMGLLRKLHPTWSPAAIRSAIMTSAIARDNTGNLIRDHYTNQAATPFAYGAGHIKPNHAMYPGLVYDMGVENYLTFLCAYRFNATQMGSFIGSKPYRCSTKKMKAENMNNPSFALPSLNKTMTVSRTVKNVGAPGTYRVKVRAPLGIVVIVEPKVLEFKELGEEKEFRVTFKSTAGSVGKGYFFGSLVWTDGRHYVRSPIAVNAAS